ncbi:endoglucanase [Kwoniella mangroviensis CBS 8886]|nr:endoglucanase [Kwoniella mangroviensis CBS 8886]
MSHLLILFSLSLSLPSITAQLTPSPTYTPPTASAGLASSTATPNTQWSNALGNSLYFYDAQRSGRLSEGSYGNRVEWRNDSALQDGEDYGLDLTGGFYDAGDYIKATFPLTFTLFALAWGALTHGEGYDQAQQTAYLDGTLRWGYDWLIKAHPSDDVLFVQVGSGDVDNGYWGGDENIPTPRPAYPVNSSSPGTDAWSSAAAAFALGSMLYTPSISYNLTSSSSPPTSPSLGNSTYSSLLLSHARSLYNASNSTSPKSTYYESLGEEVSAYASSNWQDDYVLSALSLAIATNQSNYYLDAYNGYVSYALSGLKEVWNWDSAIPAIYVMFSEVAITRPGLAPEVGLNTNLTGWRNETEAYFDSIIDGSFKRSYLTKGGLLYFDGDSDEASLNPAMAIAMLMFRYAPIASSQEKTDEYNAFAQGQLEYMLGNNPMNAVYLVGSHPNSPQNPHSAPASGGSDILHIRNSPPTEAHVLYGAMVGGPLDNDRFWDWRDDWVQTEIALDYNAMIPTLAAMQLLNQTSDPYYVQVQAGTYSIPSGQPCDAALPCGGGLSTGAKAGIAIGVILGVLFILAGIFYWKRKQIARWWRKGYRR